MPLALEEQCKKLSMQEKNVDGESFKNIAFALCKKVVNLRKVTIYLLTSCNTEERIAQNIYTHNSNRN